MFGVLKNPLEVHNPLERERLTKSKCVMYIDEGQDNIPFFFIEKTVIETLVMLENYAVSQLPPGTIFQNRTENLPGYFILKSNYI